jgi:ABC-type multidrug transport system ATPase subunit
MGRSLAHAEADRVLDVVRLTDRRSERIGRLSHGMRRRVAVASALLGSPDLVLLDEPTAGLDPVQARSLRQALASLRGVQTLVVSSHNLDELERLCDWVVMMDSGECITQGPLAEVVGRTSRVAWTLGPGEVPLDGIRAAVPEQEFAVDGQTLLQTAGSVEALDQGSVAVMSQLAEAGIAVRRVQRGVGLERRFFEAAGEDVNPL